MFLTDWFYGILGFFGFSKKEAKILFLGLDNAGKSTLLRMLTNQVLHQFEPTLMPISEELYIGKIKIKAFDLGGHQMARRIWKDYYNQQVDAVVFLVDASDPERFKEAKKELDNLLLANELANAPFLILGNKIDRPSAVPEHELRNQLGLANYMTSQPIQVRMCSVARNMGYDYGFTWLSQYLE